jgi:hypothetical protein
VLQSAYAAKPMPLDEQKWIVPGVALYASAAMLLSARRRDAGLG